MRSQRALTIVGLLSVAALAITGCTSAEGNNGEAGDDNYHVYALLPQGTDQPYGTTYLPPMEAKAAELGISLTITNSQYDADRQASECEVAIAAQPDLIILWPAVGDTVRPCLAAAQSAGIPVTVTNSDVNPEDKSLTAAFSGPDTYGQGVASAEIMCDRVCVLIDGFRHSGPLLGVVRAAGNEG
ncbi:MAG TPA: substrate-binding domain-containing protein, partial [Terrimesophilobacter sp.]|nr:substrate-binding domain-containing protein [Terrimesophilobacter sp.]